MSTDRLGFRLPLGVRIFLATAVLVAVAVALAAFFTLQQGRKAGAGAVEQSLAAANAAQARLEALSFEKLDIIAQTITNDADFVRYVEQATNGGEGLGEASPAPADGSDAAADPALDPAAAAAAVPEPQSDTASVKDLIIQQCEAYGSSSAWCSMPKAGWSRAPMSARPSRRISPAIRCSAR